MAKSSINFKKVSLHSFLHNDRTEKIKAKSVYEKYSYLNSYSNSAKKSKDYFDMYFDTAISKVKGKTRKADRSNCLWEAVVNINENTTMEDLEKLSLHIEKEFGFTGIQIAIHRDEGHFEGDKFICNNHAHLSFFTLNLNNGRQMFRREHISKDKLRELQTKTAEILGMERGQDKRISKKERLNHKEYKQAKQQEQEIINKELANQRDLKEEIKKLREQLKQSGTAKRADYAELEELNRNLAAQIKSKDLKIEELQAKLNDFIKVKIEDTEEIDGLRNAFKTTHEELQEQKKLNTKIINDFTKVKKENLELMQELEQTKLTSFQRALKSNYVTEEEIKEFINNKKIQISNALDFKYAKMYAIEDKFFKNILLRLNDNEAYKRALEFIYSNYKDEEIEKGIYNTFLDDIEINNSDESFEKVVTILDRQILKDENLELKRENAELKQEVEKTNNILSRIYSTIKKFFKDFEIKNYSELAEKVNTIFLNLEDKKENTELQKELIELETNRNIAKTNENDLNEELIENEKEIDIELLNEDFENSYEDNKDITSFKNLQNLKDTLLANRNELNEVFEEMRNEVLEDREKLNQKDTIIRRNQ